MLLECDLLDGDGRHLVRLERYCIDRRTLPREPMLISGPVRMVPSTDNYEEFQVPRAAALKVRSARLRFTRVHRDLVPDERRRD